ncbi:SecDF P1 head subdomain-containing protein [Ruania alba]|uniref:SecDF P1 head subdomain domain-containing protein n=1 Tax=Ruania alba TaxID=648782 RepID=A0A1H5KA65_9MICO|nr:hypothetical protein [Ruania alba]SEE61712.1 hypothetical protein SAMN04488554_2162 [Ruania alba]
MAGAVVLGGCGTSDPGSDAVTLAAPFVFALVDEVRDGPDCDDGYHRGPDGTECLALTEQVDVQALQRLELGESVDGDGETTGETVVQIEFLPDEAEEFAALTEAASASGQGRIALLVDGAVVSAPVVAESITGGAVTISGWNESEARAFVERAN